MSEQAKSALIMRVQEWASWMPMQVDPTERSLLAVQGESAVVLATDEQLAEISVMPTDKTKQVPVEASNGEPAHYVQHKLVLFRATFTRRGTLAPPPPEKSKLVVKEHYNQ